LGFADPEDARRAVDAVYRAESRRVLATLIRLLGDFDLAEEALHDAFAAALEQWPRAGVPASPRAWLVSAGRFKAIDAIRRRARHDASLAELGRRLESLAPAPPAIDETVEDDRLRLIFTCCHPALTPDAQIALTLRTVCGLTTEEIAHAFLTKPSTLAQRIVRAKGKIRDAGIPYDVPALAELPERLDAVLHVVYLVFNEGYASSSGATLTRPDLSAEAIRLGRLLLELLPEPEVMGLLALMLLHESRRAARTSPDGEVVLLEEQDRAIWDRAMIAEGVALVERALASRRFGPYSLQAAIAAVHAEAPSAAATDWAQIVGTLRRAAARRAHPGDRAEPRRRGGDARRAGGRARPDRRDPGARGSGGLPVRARGARRPVPAARPERAGDRLLSRRAGAHAPGAGAAVHHTPAHGAGRALTPCPARGRPPRRGESSRLLPSRARHPRSIAGRRLGRKRTLSEASHRSMKA
jgi:RNA polymerase sigma-70 factor (ECF subfamily)